MVNLTQLPRKWLVIGLILLAVGAGLMLGFRPLSAFWLQQQGGAAVVELSRNLPADSGGFACLAEPLQNAEVQARLGKAINQLEQASRLLPEQAHLYYLLGRAYCMAGKYDLAVQVLPIFSELRPKNPQADLELGFALEKLCPPRGECEKITTKQVWQRAGVLPEHLIANGEAARKKEDFSRAVEWYQRAEAMGADLRSTIAFVRYQAALKEGREEEAYTALEEAVRTDTGWANADLRFLGWYRLIRFLFDYRQDNQNAEILIDLAIKMVQQEVKFNSILSEMYRIKGWIRSERGFKEDAIYYLEKSINLNPNNAWVYVSYGKALYLFEKDTQKSMSYFRRALNVEDSPDLQNSIVQFWLAQNRISEVIKICLETGSMIEACNLYQDK